MAKSLQEAVGKSGEAEATPPAPAQPGLTPVSLPTQVYKVTLPGCKPRVVDDQGRPQLKEFLNVAATSPGDAFEKFKEHNGIIGTQSKPEIALVDEPADIPLKK